MLQHLRAMLVNRNTLANDSLSIIAGNQEFVFLSLFHIDIRGIPQNPVDLSNIDEIEWRFAPFSVLKEKGVAVLRKKWTAGDIIILEDGSDGSNNLIQITIKSSDTTDLYGNFLHQVIITDNSGTVFVPFEGLINVNRLIQAE